MDLRRSSVSRTDHIREEDEFYSHTSFRVQVQHIPPVPIENGISGAFADISISGSN